VIWGRVAAAPGSPRVLSCLYSHGLDLFVLEYFGPETGQNVRILDFNHCELLQDTVVQAELLLLESADDFVANVEGEQVVKLRVGNNLALVLLHLVSHAANIFCILEQRSRGLLTLLHAVNVLLSVALLALEASQFVLDLVASANCLSHRLDIVDFALHPVVELNVRVAQARASYLQGLA